MKNYFITFRSVTFAQRGERALRRAGIECVLQRAPRFMEERGCGYSLAVRQADVPSAVTLLQREQVPMRKVYLRREDGVMEEAAL